MIKIKWKFHDDCFIHGLWPDGTPMDDPERDTDEDLERDNG